MKHWQWIICIGYGILIGSYLWFDGFILNQWLSTLPVFAHFYAFSILFGIGLGIVFLLRIIYLLGFRKNHMIWFSVVMFVLSSFLIFGDFHFGIKQKQVSGSSFTVVEYNLENRLSQNQLEYILTQQKADIVVFVEITLQKVQQIMKDAKYALDDYQFFESSPKIGSIAPIVVLIRQDLGIYESQTPEFKTAFGTLKLKAKTANLPDLVAVHTAPPLPFLIDQWKKDLQDIANFYKDDQNTFIVGDFNATMHHGSLAYLDSYQDTLSFLPFAENGTWHQKMYPIFQTTIDHVLVPKQKTTILDVRTKRFRSSDHICTISVVQYHP